MDNKQNILIMTLNVKYILFFILIITFTNCQKMKNMSTIQINVPITQKGIQNQWATIQQLLNKAKPKRLYITSTVMDLPGITKLFSYNLTSIREIKIQQTVVNKQIMKFILKRQKIYEIQQLILISCNIFDEDFQVLQQRNTQIKKLDLSINVISELGFVYFSRLKMNLNQLTLARNSLITTAAVNAVISFGLASIKKLNLCQTSISGQNLLRILQEIGSSKLETLRICSNNFQQSFYQKFSKFNFSALKYLDLEELNIDQQGFKYFLQMDFPNLIQFNLNKNQLNNNLGQQLFTKTRMPKLHTLMIDQNFITAKFIRHLKKQGFVFKYLTLNVRKIQIDSLQALSQLNTSSLQTFSFSSAKTHEESLSNFIKNTNFSSLKGLIILKMRNTQNYFQAFLERKWQKLQDMVLQPDIIKIDPSFYKNGVIFPQLKNICVKFTGLNQPLIIQFLKNIQKIAPKIQKLQISARILNECLDAVLNGTLSRIYTKNITIILTSQFPYPSTFQLTFYPDKLSKIKRINLPNLFLNVLFAKGQLLIQQVTNITDISQLEDIDFQQFLNIAFYISKFQDILHSTFDFSQLVVLQQSYQLNFLKRLLQNNKNQFIFKQLQQLKLQIDEETQLQILQKCQFPFLKTLLLQSSYSQQVPIDLSGLSGKFPYLTKIQTDLPLNKQQLKNFFKNNTFNYLRSLNLQEIQNITAVDFKQIYSQIPYVNRIRYFYFDKAFINNDLTFLSNTGIKPGVVSFSNILFNTGIIKQLCSIDFQFLYQLRITNSGLDDKNLLQLLQCIQTKKYPYQLQNRPIHFPKLKQIIFNNNYLNKKGFQKLMSFQLPLLINIQMNQNADSQIFNSLFHSNSSKRLTQFQLTQRKFDSIDSTINIKNTRRVQVLTFAHSILYDTDIQTLSKMQFYSLQILEIGITKIQNCQILQHLLQLTKNVIQIKILISNSPKLNSTCLIQLQQLIDNNNNTSIIQPTSLIISGNQYYGQISHFVQKLIKKSQQWQVLGLQNVYFDQNTAIKILQQSTFINVSALAFKSCGLTDTFVQELAQYKLQGLQQLDLSDNPITGQSLVNFNNITFTNLVRLTLSKTLIGDLGIKYLIRNKFPAFLFRLFLQNIQLTRQGILLLNQLNAPKIVSISLSCNDLTIDDLLLFDVTKFPMLVQIQVYPSLKRQQYERLLQKYNDNQRKLPCVIITTVIQPTPYDIYLEQQADFYDDHDDQQQEIIQ